MHSARAFGAAFAAVGVYTSSTPGFGDSSSRLSGPNTPVSETVLRIARSDDGLRFRDDGQVLVHHAAGPDVVVLRSGDVLAFFDYVGSAEPNRLSVPAVSRSHDGGRTWSAPQGIAIAGAESRRAHVRHLDAVAAPGGKLLLYYIASDTGRSRQTRLECGELTAARSEESGQGIEFRVERSEPLSASRGEDAHPLAIRVRDRLHLYVTEFGRDRTTREGTVNHLFSADGLRFATLRPPRVPEGVTFLGSMITEKRGLRAYVSTERGIQSAVSKDGHRWKLEREARVPGGWDPAVARLKDGKYLMVYCAPAGAESLAATPLAVGNDATGFVEGDADPIDWGSEVVVNPSLIDEDELGDGGYGADDIGTVVVDGHDADHTATAEAGIVVTGATPKAPAENADSEAPTADPASFDWRLTWDPVASGGFAPKPTFEGPVDYFDWYKDFAVEQPAENAHDSYAAIGTVLEGPEGQGLLTDMFNSEGNPGPPAPWKPEDHPDWATAGDRVQPLLDQFRAASRMSGYAPPPKTGGEDIKDLPEGERLLLGILLPALQPHRQALKALLADAWRTDAEGNVSPQKMLDAWQTAFHAAGHLERGPTLIENVVARSEREFVYENARWALKHEVFRSPEELQRALDTLQRSDKGPTDMARSLRGEHGFAMDITQYLFSPPGEDGRPKVNPDRVEALRRAELIKEADVPRYEAMTAEDAYATLDAFDNHYRRLGEQMNIGYPDVRAADIGAFEQSSVHTSPVTETMLPALSRYHQLRARAETSRRATQLAYAVHSHYARTGSWPASLRDVARTYGREITTDPFTGVEFGYRLTDDGPVIYSRGENARDDGGVHAPRWDSEPDPATGSDDHVFWPPQERPR